MKTYSIQQTITFKRDMRRLGRQAKDLRKLAWVLGCLKQGVPLPRAYKNHFLHGFPGYQELHLEFDWLLIYQRRDQNVRLIRTGSHAELF